MVYGEFGEDQSKTLSIELFFCVEKELKVIFGPEKIMELHA